MNTRKLLVILNISFICFACTNETPKLANTPFCKISSPTNNAFIGLNDSVVVKVIANDSVGNIDNVKLFVDNIEYGKTTIFPYEFIIKKEYLTPGYHTLLVIATNINGEFTKDSITINKVRNNAVSCKITLPLNNYCFKLDESVNINVAAFGDIIDVKLFVDNIEYSVNKGIYPIKFIINNGVLTVGKHKLLTIATDYYGFIAKDSININQLENNTVIITQPDNYRLYEGDFTFTTRTVSWVLSLTTTDTTVNSGKIKFTQDNLITIYYKENENVSFQFNGGNFISEGDWYDTGGKEGRFIGLDSVAFHLKTPGYRSGTNTWVTGKRN